MTPTTATQQSRTGPPPRHSVPPVLDSGISGNVVRVDYDVAPDGERFLIPERLGGERKIHVVQNWFAAFRK